MTIRLSLKNNRGAVVLCSYSSVTSQTAPRNRGSNPQGGRNYKLIIVVVSIDMIRARISRFGTMEYIKEILCFLFVTSQLVKNRTLANFFVVVDVIV